MEFLIGVYLFYSFFSLYFLFLFALLYLKNCTKMYSYEKYSRLYSLSIVVPCYNGAESIGRTIQKLVESDYPGLKKIVVVDDCSKDNSYEIMKEYAKKYPQVIAVQTPKNTGCAAGAKNYGTKFVDTELVGFTDDDTFIRSDAISHMVGVFNDEKAGAVTSRVLVKRTGTWLETFQSIEYKIIAFTRKLFGFVGAIYVTNGPLSIYRKKAYDQAGGFDEKNMTEDIEITWHFVSQGWDVHMCMPAVVYTVAPNNIKEWFKQRLRWNIGGVQTIKKYYWAIFGGAGMLGYFILPYFVSAWLLGITGLGFLVYRGIRRIIFELFFYNYSTQAEVARFVLSDLNLNPTVLMFFGVVILMLSFAYTFTGLLHSREKDFKTYNVFAIVGYMFFYLLSYPPLLIYSIYKFFTGKFSW